MQGKTTLFFDLDNTLLDEETATEEAFLVTIQAAAKQYEFDPQQLYHAVLVQARRLWMGHPLFNYCNDIQITYTEGLCANFSGTDERLGVLQRWGPVYRRESWHNALLAQGISAPDLAEFLGEKYKEERRKRFFTFPDVYSTLQALRETYQLGIITNGSPDLQWEKISKAKLEQFFAEIIVSGEIGSGKPNRKIFDEALQRFGCAAHEAVMIGDNMRTDIRGANQAGLTAVWVNHRGSVKDENIKPSYEIGRLGELKTLLHPAG